VLQSTTEEAAIDIAFLSATFFEHFSELKGREFHMAGESYGGRYIPLFASAVHDLNPRLEKAGFAPVNLTSILIGKKSRRGSLYPLTSLAGNGLTDFATMTPSYYDMQCSGASIPPVSDIAFVLSLSLDSLAHHPHLGLACA
jgi:carboxypeptidase C (cathepsin A)